MRDKTGEGNSDLDGHLNFATFSKSFFIQMLINHDSALYFGFWLRDMNVTYQFLYTSRPASDRASVLFITAFVFSPCMSLSSHYTNCSCVPYNFNPISNSWICVMTYSKAKVKSDDDKASPCSRPFCIRQVTSLNVSFKHICLS